MKFRVALLGVLAAAATITIGPKASADDLADAIDAALATHPRLQQERATLRAAREAIPIALAPYRPQLSFQATTARSDREAELSSGQIIDDETSPSTFTLDARQTLWSGGRRAIAHRQAVLSLRAAQARFASAQQAIASDTASALLELILAHEVLDIEIDAVRVLSEQLDAVQQQQRRGVATRTDIAQTQARLAEAQARLASAQGNLRLARSRFERMTGYDVTNAAWPSLTLPWQSLLDAQDAVRDNNHDLAEAQIQAEIARLEVLNADRRNSPTLSLGVQRSESQNVSPAVISDDETQVNLTFNMPLWTGGDGSARRREAIANRTAVRHGVRDLEAELSLTTAQDWARLEAAQFALEAQLVRLEAAELALEGVRRGRSAGLWSLADELDATDQLLNAQRAVAQANADQRAAEFRLALLGGELGI